MNYYGGLAGTIAEIWFFTHKDVSYKTKIAAIIAFWIIITTVLGVVALIGYAEQSVFVMVGCAILELMFIVMGIIWWQVSKKVRIEVEGK